MLGVLVSFAFTLTLRSTGRLAMRRCRKLSTDGLTGALTARAEAHSIRLALIYALLDGASSIELDHLKAALALWDYAARGAEWALGDTTGVPLAEQLYRTLSDDPDELSRSQLRDSLNRNYPAAQVLEALESLERDGRAKRRMRKNPNGGRPAELWRAITPETAATPQRSDRPILTRVA